MTSRITTAVQLAFRWAEEKLWNIGWQPSASVLDLADRELRSILPWVLSIAAAGSIAADGTYYLLKEAAFWTTPFIVSHAVALLMSVYWIRNPVKHIKLLFIGAYVYLAIFIVLPSVLFQRPTDLVQLGVLSMAAFYLMMDVRYLFACQAFGFLCMLYSLFVFDGAASWSEEIWITVTVWAAGLALYMGRRKTLSYLEETRTALRQEAALRERAEEMGRISKERESLAAMVGGVAHDFNNLLLGITGGIELARLDNQMSVSSVRALDIANDSSQAAKDLCGSLLEHSRGKRLSPTSLNLAELVASATRHVEAIRAPRCAVVTELNGTSEELFGDHSQLRQVLINLLDNAIHVAKTKVVIRTTATTLDGLDWIRIEIEDDGPGIDEDTRRQIFDPFFTTRVDGKGLGLATVSATVSAHGGRVLVEESSTGGACFIVLLPSSLNRSAPSPGEIHYDTPDISANISANVTTSIPKIEPPSSLGGILAKVFDDLPYLVFYKDTNNRNLRVNSVVGRLRGVPLEEFEGTPARFWHPDEADSYYEDDQEVIAKRCAKFGIEEQIEIAPGEKYWFLTDKYPTFAEDDSVDGVLAICKLANASDETALRETIDSRRAS